MEQKYASPVEASVQKVQKTKQISKMISSFFYAAEQTEQQTN